MVPAGSDGEARPQVSGGIHENPCLVSSIFTLRTSVGFVCSGSPLRYSAAGTEAHGHPYLTYRYIRNRYILA
jgi:hypothetical protein